MSAFVVPHAHIDALVSWAIDHKVPCFFAPDTPRSVAAELFEENCCSVDHCYKEVNIRDYVFTYRDEARHLSPVQVIKACKGLEYQSCEHPGWSSSDAQYVLRAIASVAVRKLPGYEAADWVLDEPELMVLGAGGAA